MKEEEEEAKEDTKLLEELENKFDGVDRKTGLCIELAIIIL